MTFEDRLFVGDAPISEARLRLGEPRRPEPVLGTLGASALLALSALVLAAAVILGPFWQTYRARPVVQAGLDFNQPQPDRHPAALSRH